MDKQLSLSLNQFTIRRHCMILNVTRTLCGNWSTSSEVDGIAIAAIHETQTQVEIRCSSVRTPRIQVLCHCVFATVPILVNLWILSTRTQG